MCIGVLPACMSVHHLYIVSEENISSPGTGVRDSYELLCGCWKSNPDPLEEELVYIAAKATLQPTFVFSCYLETLVLTQAPV